MPNPSLCPPVQRKGTGAGLLVLEDGTVYWGTSIGAHGEAFGEFVFNTGMTGYQEVLTDPSYRGQIVVMTYPEIGIYGVNPDDVESAEIQVAGFVVHRAVKEPFNQRATSSFPDYLKCANIVGVEGVDTRAITRHIRTRGAMRGAISNVDLNPHSLLERVRRSPQMVGQNLVQEVSPPSVLDAQEAESGALRVLVVDAGMKQGIVRGLLGAFPRIGIVRIPYDADVQIVLSMEPDGVLVSNGPGDPATLESTVRLVRGLIQHRIPLAGICLGHQLLGLALGGQTYKMRFGHRGINHPVKDLETGRVLITTQNHGFAIDPTSLGIPWRPLDAGFQPADPDLLDDGTNGVTKSQTMASVMPDYPLVGRSSVGLGSIEITHLSLNDGTLEGLRLRDGPAFSVQYHPEASPGPHDAGGFFDQFIDLMGARCA